MAFHGFGAPVYPQDHAAQVTSYSEGRAAAQGIAAGGWTRFLASPATWLLLVLAYALYIRLWNIAGKVMHHDESLFAYYGYWLFRGNGYDYQPILHGPVLQYVSAFFFLLFGDDQFTMRLPSLLGGLGMFVVAWCWRRYLGVWGVVGAFLLLALSPSITFYTRFLRNDVPYLAVTLWCGLCLVRLYDTGRSLYAWGAVLTATLMFCMMESSIFFFSACLGFLGTIVLWDWLLGKRRVEGEDAAPGAERHVGLLEVSICMLVAFAITVFLGWLFHRVLYASIHIYKPVQALFGKPAFLTPDKANWLFAFVVFLAVWALSVAAYLNFREPRGRRGVAHLFLHTMWRNRWPVVAALALSVAAYQTLFTTFFTFTETASFDHGERDFKGPVKALTPVQIYKNTWDYWWDQHKLHRIKGPFHYYLPILASYELLLLLVVAWGWLRTALRRPERWLHIALFLGLQLSLTAAYFAFLHETINWKTMDDKFHLTHWFHLNLVLLYVQLLVHIAPLLYFTGRRVEAFLTYWGVTSLFAYSYAGEKVPWLTVHTVGPLVLFGGIQLGRIWQSSGHWSARRRNFAFGILTVAVLYQVRTQHFLNVVHPHNPAERLVYNHTSPDLQEALQIVDEIGRETGFGRQLPMFIQGEMSWPLHWYLRRYPNAMTTTEQLDTTTRPIVMVDWTYSDNQNLNSKYWVRRMKVREWWEPPMLNLAAMSDIWRALTPRESRSKQGLNSIASERSLLEWKKLFHYIAYREIWIDPDNAAWSNGANEFAFGVRKDLNRTYSNFRWLGLLPKRRDITTYP